MSLTEKITKYCSGLGAAVVLAAAVSVPSCCGQSFYQYHNPIQQQDVSFRNYTNFVRGAFDGKYDNHHLFHEDSLDNLLETTHKIYGHLTIEVTRFDYSGDKPTSSVTERTMTGNGSAVAIHNADGRLTLLTANHVVTPPALEDEFDEQRRPLVRYKVKEVNYILEQADMFVPLVAVPFVGMHRLSSGPELQVVARDRNRDIAIVQTKKEFAEAIKNYRVWSEFGNSSELEPGDFLYMVGYPLNITKQVMNGYVSSKGNPFTEDDDFEFIADISANKGNSGGPVYALRDGKPELVGIVRSKWPEGIGGIVRIDHAKDLIRKAGLGGILK